MGYYPATPDPTFTAVNYTNVLLPGELALCTDSGNVYMGNLNGGFIQFAEQVSTAGEFLNPAPWILPPVTTFTAISSAIGIATIMLDYQATPFYTIEYSVTDSSMSDWNSVGVNFARNGAMCITAVNSATQQPNSPVQPPLIAPINPPIWSTVNLNDTSSEVNATQYDISFKAQYNNNRIEIMYIHNFPGNLTLYTNTITWIAF